jgi:hypothetical protein
MTTLIYVAGAAALFLLFGLLSPKIDCAGHCGACPGDCALKKERSHD